VSKAIHRADHSPVDPPNTPPRSLGELRVTDGFYVNLDRRGLNDLIRHLRRARDHAFGRDE
jgi:hypothetical protein